jgi:hypothetical protein
LIERKSFIVGSNDQPLRHYDSIHLHEAGSKAQIEGQALIIGNAGSQYLLVGSQYLLVGS